MKKIAVGNLGEEELARLTRTVLTREDTRAEADLLFGGPAKDMRKADRKLLEKLFVQTPASVTMAPNLQKNASKDEPHSKGERAALLAGALGTGAAAANEARHMFRGTESKHGYLGYLSIPAAVAGVAIKRRLQGKKAFPTGGSAIHAGGKSKTSSVTSNVDAFFEKLAAPSDAQLRYPELLKVAASDTKKVLNLKPRVTTETSGPTPTRSSLSGGSA